MLVVTFWKLAPACEHATHQHFARIEMHAEVGELRACARRTWQARSGVRCVYASVAQPARAQQAALSALEAAGALSYTTVVAAPEGAAACATSGTESPALLWPLHAL